MKIRAKLSFSALIATFCLLAVGGTGVFYIDRTAEVSQVLVDKKAEPIVRLNELEKTAWEILSRLIVHVSSHDMETMDTLNGEILQLEKRLASQLEQVKKTHMTAGLSIPEELAVFQKNWKLFQGNGAEALQLSAEFTKEDALLLVIGEGREVFNQALASLRKLVRRYRADMDVLRDQAGDTVKHAVWLVGGITAAVGLFIFVFLLRVAVNISRPLHTAVETAKRINAGDLTARAAQYDGDDEIAVLLGAMNEMAEGLQNTIQELSTVLGAFSEGSTSSRINAEFIGDFARLKEAVNEMAENIQILIAETRRSFGKLAEGNMAVRVTHDFPGDFTAIKQAANDMAEEFQAVIHETSRVLGLLAAGDMEVRVQKEFVGDFAEIKTSLSDAAAKLGAAMRENERQNWLKSGYNQLAEKLSGEQSTLDLADRLIHFLCTYLKAQMGALYILENDAEEAYLKITATYAYTRPEGAPERFSLGEGLVGEAALSDEGMVITEIPESYFELQSGLGKHLPTCIILLPLYYEGQLKGVVELASLKMFDADHQAFLHQTLPAAATALNSAESRSRMQDMLAADTRVKSE